MIKSILPATVFIALMSIAGAAAQSAVGIAVEGGGKRVSGMMMNADQFQQGSIRINSQFSFFVPGPVGDSDEANKLREQARRSLYKMMARECDLLRDTIAKDCRVESMNVNVNLQMPQSNQWTTEGLQVNGFVQTQVILK